MRRRVRLNKKKYNKYLCLSDQNEVIRIIYVHAGLPPKGICYEIDEKLQVKAGDKVDIQEDGKVIVQDKQKKKKTWWKL